MKYSFNNVARLFYFFSLPVLVSCNSGNKAPSKEAISEVNLKRGEIISCGATDKQFGSVDFEMSCGEKIKKDFNLAVELLHSFEYDESEKVFAKIIDENPECAMAYWGVAMCNFHALWTPPTEAELAKGNKAIEIANTISKKTARESDYINAIAIFYKDWNSIDHHTRCVKYEKAMEKIYNNYPNDKEAAIFYALALDASANPNDKSYVNQKKAASILTALNPAEPDHPGIIHYIIHTYDYPGLAELALPAAKKYAAVAPSSAHALHMPSHIFTRLGLWDECIQSNLASVASAKCYAEQAGIKGHWDEELHGLDYLVYAYLQKGENRLAKESLNYLDTINEVYPVNFKVAYAFAAIPSRFFLENKNWNGAANIQIHPSNFPWKKFPWQESIVHFARLLGAAHLGNMKEAGIELSILKQLRDTLAQQKDSYKTQQVSIQVKAGEAWIQFYGGSKTEALTLMKLAADSEDSTEKHPVTPGEVLPARELLADMLLESKQYENALQSYEAVLKKSPNRFNSLYGAGFAAEKSGNKEKAIYFYKQLLAIANTGNIERPEIGYAKKFLAMK
ncbi:MAG: tetratricopeptide repeat protein [Bacteroidetes bacterium]|nr:tetratricopeptide repeat protein [Bacteroidota bacterium]